MWLARKCVAYAACLAGVALAIDRVPAAGESYAAQFARRSGGSDDKNDIERSAVSEEEPIAVDAGGKRETMASQAARALKLRQKEIKEGRGSRPGRRARGGSGVGDASRTNGAKSADGQNRNVGESIAAAVARNGVKLRPEEKARALKHPQEELEENFGNRPGRRDGGGSGSGDAGGTDGANAANNENRSAGESIAESMARNSPKPRPEKRGDADGANGANAAGDENRSAGESIAESMARNGPRPRPEKEARARRFPPDQFDENVGSRPGRGAGGGSGAANARRMNDANAANWKNRNAGESIAETMARNGLKLRPE